MAIINVEQANIKTVGVQIKALTVGSKQVTLSLFRQIMEENLIDHINLKLNGTPWGQVNYFWKTENEQHKIHVLWQKGAELRRCVLLRKAISENERIYTSRYALLANQVSNFQHEIMEMKGEAHYLNDAYISNCEVIKSLERYINEKNRIIDEIKKGANYYGSIEEIEEKINIAKEQLNHVLDTLKSYEEELINSRKELQNYETNYNALLEPLIDLPHLFIAI